MLLHFESGADGRPCGAPRSMRPLELVLFGAARNLFGLVSGAVLTPWLVDRGLSPVPVARRVMTTERASSSSGEKGSTRRSSTPSSKARSLVLRSPRRVRLPPGQDGVRLGQAACGPHDEEAVVEGELDEAHDERAIVEHQGTERRVLVFLDLVAPRRAR